MGLIVTVQQITPTALKPGRYLFNGGIKMAKQYSTGLIGLDLKPKKILRTDYPTYKRKRKQKWLAFGILAITTMLYMWLRGD